MEPSVRGNVMAASAVLAGLVLEKDSIRQILRSDAIPSKMTMTTITLQLPQNIYESLQKAAARAGQSPEELITQLLGQTVQNFADDPLEEFIGAFRSDIPDWAENHDRYLGKELMENHNA